MTLNLTSISDLANISLVPKWAWQAKHKHPLEIGDSIDSVCSKADCMKQGNI